MKAEPTAPDLGLTGNDFRKVLQLARLSLQMVDGQVLPDVIGVLREINKIQPVGGQTLEQKISLPTPAAPSLKWCGQRQSREQGAGDLRPPSATWNNQTQGLPRLLLSAPICSREKQGGISYIVSFCVIVLFGAHRISTAKNWPPSSRILQRLRRNQGRRLADQCRWSSHHRCLVSLLPRPP
jgi:hypothetical protein